MLDELSVTRWFSSDISVADVLREACNLDTVFGNDFKQSDSNSLSLSLLMTSMFADITSVHVFMTLFMFRSSKLRLAHNIQTLSHFLTLIVLETGHLLLVKLSPL